MVGVAQKPVPVIPIRTATGINLLATTAEQTVQRPATFWRSLIVAVISVVAVMMTNTT